MKHLYKPNQTKGKKEKKEMIYCKEQKNTHYTKPTVFNVILIEIREDSTQIKQKNTFRKEHQSTSSQSKYMTYDIGILKVRK